ncbi:hypothetical protein LUPAC06_00978 [Micromonospora saelicesensis]|nr:hypothetical protein LUPAC06_00978 [Micromonospora saelicesensis]
MEISLARRVFDNRRLGPGLARPPILQLDHLMALAASVPAQVGVSPLSHIPGSHIYTSEVYRLPERHRADGHYPRASEPSGQA